MTNPDIVFLAPWLGSFPHPAGDDLADFRFAENQLARVAARAPQLPALARLRSRRSTAEVKNRLAALVAPLATSLPEPPPNLSRAATGDSVMLVAALHSRRDEPVFAFPVSP